jgi:outer membrane protein OmpA-like peptidoglycan-associated protein
MRILIIYIILITGKVCFGQQFQLKPLNLLNTPANEIACSRFEDQLIYMSGTENDLVNDYQWDSPAPLRLYSAKHGSTYSDWYGREKFFKKATHDLGPMCFAAADSVAYFCSSENFGKAKGEHLKLYQCKWDGQNWHEPILLPFCADKADFVHPCYDASTRLLIYSSNCRGGFGGMDIWYVYRLDNGWGEPVNAGIMVNTTFNEIFPVYDSGDIIFSSNQPGGRGGYDLRKALGNQQWKAIVSLNEPFNSPGDDMTLLRLTDEKWILSSTRTGGLGGDDVYVIERVIPKEEYNPYLAELSCGGQPHNHTSLNIVNEYGELVSNQFCDSLGRVDISMLRFSQGYRIQLGGIDPSLYADCVLVIKDEKGNKLREIRFNMNGFADLELLPLSFGQLNLLPLEDESVLRINIEGQLYEQKPGDVGRDEPVTILDEEGNPLAIAYTNDSGRFRFTKVEPQAEYTFRLSKETAAKHVLITDRGERITLPVLNAEIAYTRVHPDEAIELIDEYNQKIVISPKDLFVINRIYYQYNSSKLTGEASAQLDQIGIVMQRNPKIMLELRSHTDSRGDAAYNKALSAKRAKAAVQYLTSKGLATSRFKTEGLGEEELLNECSDGVECSDPEHSINRRTEIRITKSTTVR